MTYDYDDDRGFDLGDDDDPTPEELMMTAEEYCLNRLRRINPDGTVTARNPFKTRGWTELCIAMQREIDRLEIPRSDRMYAPILTGIEIGLLNDVGGRFCEDHRVLRFEDLESWEKWADRYERFDASVMLLCGIDSDEHNPAFWQKFVAGIPKGESYDENESRLRRRLEKDWGAEINHDGRYELVHWRVDFPSKEALVAFKLTHS